MAFLRAPAGDLCELNRLQNASRPPSSSIGLKKLSPIDSYRNLTIIGRACQSRTGVETYKSPLLSGFVRPSRP